MIMYIFTPRYVSSRGMHGTRVPLLFVEVRAVPLIERVFIRFFSIVVKIRLLQRQGCSSIHWR